MQALDALDIQLYKIKKNIVGLPCACFMTRISGEPYSGNLYLRFDEDSGHQPPELLYRFIIYQDFWLLITLYLVTGKIL